MSDSSWRTGILLRGIMEKVRVYHYRNLSVRQRDYKEGSAGAGGDVDLNTLP